MTERPHDPFAEIFRDHYGRVVAGLTRGLGARRIELAEDCAQEALLRAVRTWPFRGRPDDPGAWLIRTARNIASDHLRRERRDIAHREATGPELNESFESGSIDLEEDDSLKLLFLCCDDAWTPQQRVTMTLKTLCGFGVKEIASALLEKEATVAQRLSRLRSRLHGDVHFG
ncbi:MAG: sigma-70 family RNA polymerase sigma factor, partial [Planctomycetota bacterium]